MSGKNPERKGSVAVAKEAFGAFKKGGFQALAEERKKQQEQQPPPKKAEPQNYKHGGVVKKSGMAMVHKGERIIPKRGK